MDKPKGRIVEGHIMGDCMQNLLIEIHDSTLDSISVREGQAVLHFSSVYIHQSIGRPGLDAGTGWEQEALLRVRNAVVNGAFSELPRDIQDGHISTGVELELIGEARYIEEFRP